MIAALLPALAIAGVEAWQQRGGAEPTDLPAPFPSPADDWTATIAAIDTGIANHRARAAHEPTDWLSPESEARAWMERAQLTARWQDYAEAERAINLARERAPTGLAPFPTIARLDQMLHRNAAVAAALDAQTASRDSLEPANHADTLAMHGDLALYAGDWRAAERAYLAARALADDPALAMRQAFVTERTAGPDVARPLWLRAGALADRPSRRLVNALAMRLGNNALQRGDWDEAATWYAKARRTLPGDWRAEALVQQMRAMKGDLAGAIAALAPIAAQRDIPELWDALASWRRANGDVAGAAADAARAEAGWRAWAAHYPEAAAAHRADHALLVGDKAGALEAASANYRNRPYGDAATLLAAAMAANGDVARARALIRRTTQSGWRSLETDRLSFELAALDGDGAGAERARDSALARNPRAFDPAMALARFGLH